MRTAWRGSVLWAIHLFFLLFSLNPKTLKHLEGSVAEAGGVTEENFSSLSFSLAFLVSFGPVDKLSFSLLKVVLLS
jgi:hypothetical protein